MPQPIHSPLGYLFWCANEHLSFRIPEFEALAAMFDIPLNWIEKHEHKPWVILDLESELHARKLLSRIVSVKFCVQLWADETSLVDLHKTLKEYPAELSAPYCDKGKSYKIYVEAFMVKMSFEEKLRRIESFSYLPSKGPVQLNDPDIVFSNLEFYGLDNNNLSSDPLRIFFGRCIGKGQRDLISKLSIKTRKFIGKTTTYGYIYTYLISKR